MASLGRVATLGLPSIKKLENYLRAQIEILSEGSAESKIRVEVTCAGDVLPLTLGKPSPQHHWTQVATDEVFSYLYGVHFLESTVTTRWVIGISPLEVDNPLP